MLGQEPQQLGRYTLIRELGVGGMAVVYLCERQGIGGFKKQVVAKVIRPEHAENRDFVLMFLDEARLSASLSHPNVVQVFEVETSESGSPYLIMEYVHGPSLSRVVARAEAVGSVHFGHLASILAGIARGLHHAHFGDVTGGPDSPVRMVHRDVSLQNILVSTEGTPKLIDFGIAKAEGRLQETRHGLKGKLSYLAPEQLRGDKMDYRADLYSLGVCLYRATTGAYPYQGDSVAETMKNVLTGEFPPPSAVLHDYPADLERIVMRALSANPRDRFQSGLLFANALEQFAVSGPWRSDRRLVAEWVGQLYPTDDWLRGEPGSMNTGVSLGRSRGSNSGFSGGSMSAGPGRGDPTRAPVVRSGLLAVVVMSFFTMLVAVGALFVVLGFLIVQSLRVPAPHPRAPEPSALVQEPVPEPPGEPLPLRGEPATPPAPPSEPAPEPAQVAALQPVQERPPNAVSPKIPSPTASPLPHPAPGPVPSAVQPEPVPVEPIPAPVQPAPAPAPVAVAPVPTPLPVPAPAPPAPTLDRSAGNDLPADYAIRNIEQIKVVMSAIEEHAVKAGVSPGIARNVTGPLSSLLVSSYSPGAPVVVHPRAIFDRIVDGAAAGAIGGQIAYDLAKAQEKGTLK